MGGSLFSEEALITIYDDFDDGAFGRSEYRSVYRSVKLSAFLRSKSIDVASPAWDETSHLTAVVLSSTREKELRDGVYDSVTLLGDGVYHYKKEGLDFTFSLEKPNDKVLTLLEEYYRGSYGHWLESVTNHYLDNFIIRIHSAENIFEPWRETIEYNEALLMATALGDREQWLWGIHDGLDLLNR
jgi:hypothetical protein